MTDLWLGYVPVDGTPVARGFGADLIETDAVRDISGYLGPVAKQAAD